MSPLDEPRGSNTAIVTAIVAAAAGWVAAIAAVAALAVGENIEINLPSARDEKTERELELATSRLVELRDQLTTTRRELADVRNTINSRSAAGSDGPDTLCDAPALPLPREFGEGKEIETEGDRDTFRFCTTPDTGSIRAQLESTANPDYAGQIRMVLKGPEGNDLTESSGTDDDPIVSLVHNVREEGKYSIVVSCYSGCTSEYGPNSYRLSVVADEPF